MISFRDARRTVPARVLLDRLRRLVRTADALTVLVEAGAFEQGLVDALCPEHDTLNAGIENIRRLVLACGKTFVQSPQASIADSARSEIEAALDELSRRNLPPELSITAPEGYAHYALNPSDYSAASARYVRDFGVERAQKAVVLGVRSIGTSLSAAVAAVVETVHSVTIRPRGTSGERRVSASPLLTARLQEWLGGGGDVLVVDEGPGATGETLFCIGAWLSSLGVPDERVVLFPSHTGGMGLAPEARRAWFGARRKYPPEPDGNRVERVAARLGLAVEKDLSGGQWRRTVPGAEQAPSGLHHERLKYLARGAGGSLYLLRFAGLGAWGAEALERAHRLAALGLCPEVHGEVAGFMALRWQSGRVHLPGDGTGRPPAQSVTEYLTSRAGLFRTGRVVDREPVRAALLENAEEALGPGPPGLSESLRRLDGQPEREAVIADARLSAVEWVGTARGWLKVDAYDHGDGTRLPGPCDAAWDLAGAAVEFGWGDDLVESVVTRVATGRAEQAALFAAVAAYRPVYAACCLGGVDIAARETGEADERIRLYREVDRYRKALRHELERLAHGTSPVTYSAA